MSQISDVSLLESGKPAWRRARRTKAALKAKLASIEAAIRVLEFANIPYTQPLLGKLTVEPPLGVVGGLLVTFWPARLRLRLQRRPTKRQQDIRAFERALVAQGHRIAGYPPRQPASRAMRSLERARTKRESLFLQQAADLAEMEQAYEERAALHRQRLEDLAAGRRIGRRDPRTISSTATLPAGSAPRDAGQYRGLNLTGSPPEWAVLRSFPVARRVSASGHASAAQSPYPAPVCPSRERNASGQRERTSGLGEVLGASPMAATCRARSAASIAVPADL